MPQSAKNPFCITALACLFGTGAVSATESESRFFLTLENHSYSAPTSIHSFIHEFDGSLGRGDYAFVHNTLKAGVRHGAWSLAWVDRIDHFYSFSQDTARFYHEVENHLPQEPGYNYQLTLAGNHIDAGGIELRRDWQALAPLRLSASLSYLRADEFYDGSLAGNLMMDDADNYSGQLGIGLKSHRDIVLEYPVNEASGSGFSLGLSLDWRINTKWHLGMEMRDAYSTIEWDNVLDSRLRLSTVGRQVDENGLASIDPLLSGAQLIGAHRQQLPRKLFARLGWQLNDRHALEADIFHTSYFSHTGLSWLYTRANGHGVGLAAGVDTRSLGIFYQTGFGRFGISTDSWDYEEAHAVSLDFTLSIPAPW